jgi:uroporphyrinogen-III synthase
LALDGFDHVILISVNAVKIGVERLAAYWPQWPVSLRWYAVGPATAVALRGYDIEAVLPVQSSSEGLLALPALRQPAGQRILIVKGEGGRAKLSDALIGRGALVESLSVYRRTANEADLPVVDCRQLVIPVYNTDVLPVLKRWIGSQQPWLVVASARIGESAEKTGFKKVIISAGSDEQSMFSATLSASGFVRKQIEQT